MLVVYESMFGNTRAIAEAVAEGLGDAQVFPVARARERPEQPDLLVVGGPTHMHGLATSLGRRMAVEAANEDGGVSLDPEVMGTESFLVEDAEGPLQEGEAERARAWGAELARGSGG